MSDAEAPESSTSADPPAVDPPGRRELLAAVLSFLLGAVPAAIGGLFFLDPILRRSKGTDSGGGDQTMDGFVKLDITPENLVEEGPPVASTVIADLDDAWNRFKDVPIGSIWLRRQQGGEIVAFNSICPHLGCSINFRRGENDFHCPCHASSFDLDGGTTNDTPPRDMDSLEIVVATDGRPDPNGTELWVKYQNFRRGTSEKKPI
jgi:menaquinol-cytochrome c reductase iron-sulfur subunit